MRILSEILNPAYLLFPALLGSCLLGLVSPLLGAYLVLRRTVFLGLTLPQIAGAGVAFAFWLEQAGMLGKAGGGERTVGMIGSLLFTFLGMGVLGYLERRGKGLVEGRLAAAYCLAGALTILFIVFNPAGEIEILSLLKGEVIALSRTEIKILIAVFGLVFAGMILFRREFLLVSFDRDLAFLLKGGTLFWDIMIYLLAGLSIAIGVIMAGPLLIFGFLVLPPLAARPLVRGMTSFLTLSCLLGLCMAFFGFYLSVRLDLPLGPTDVALGCALVFLAYAVARFRTSIGPVICGLFTSLFLVAGCSPKVTTPLPETRLSNDSTIWLAQVRNSTGLDLRLPGSNPLRSLGEMAGKVSPDYRYTVMSLMRDSLNEEFKGRAFKTAFPESTDKRLSSFSSDVKSAAKTARDGQLSGLLLLTDIRRWSTDSRSFVRGWVDFKLIRIDDGDVLWETTVRRAIPTPSATHQAEAYTDAIKAVVHEIFG